MNTPNAAPAALPSQHYEGVLVTTDGLTLFAQGWQAAQAARSIVAVVHGYAEHSGRYAGLAAHLVGHGHAVHTYDQRGHGRSDGRRAYVHAFDRYLDDLDLFLASLQARFPEMPLFLFGHSMGGAVAALYCLERDAAVQGLLLSSPALKISQGVAPILQRLAAVVGRLLPWLPTVRLDRRLLSRDPDVVAQAEQDPLNFHGRMPARSGAELLRATKRIGRQMEALTVPLLLLHGADDGLTDPAGSADLYRRAASPDKTFHRYDGLYHETFNEPERAQVLAALTGWLNERV